MGSFEDLENMLKHIAQDLERADDRVQPWQEEIRPGDYYLKRAVGLSIYGEVLPRPQGEDFIEPPSPHLRFTRAYSAACPDGELGDVHVSTIERLLSEKDFSRAKASGWSDTSEINVNDPVVSYSLGKPVIQRVETELLSTSFETTVGLNGPAQAAEALGRLIGKKDREHFVTLYLNTQNVITSYAQDSIGNLNGALVHPREVYKGALLGNAASVIFGHNHPSGNTAPSQEDRAVMGTLARAGELLRVPMYDFLIVTPQGDYWAMSEQG